MDARYFPPQTPVGPNCVLHLKLWDGSAFDYSLSGHSGTLQGTSAYKYPGCDFDGDSDYIEVADHADFTPAGTALSISAWCYMDDASDFVIASKGVYNTDGEWVFIIEATDKVYFNIFDESVDDCYIGRFYNTALTSYQGKWVHFAGTYNGGTASSGVKIYLNGLRVDDTDFESNQATFVAVENLTHAVWIGRYINTYAEGKVDDVLIYKRELPADEIRSIYEMTRWRYQA